jgi:hypothetical protein
MPFKRELTETHGADAATLTARMAGIGMNFATEPDWAADIEATLVDASRVGIDGSDFRVLAILTTWLGVHQAHVNADRLIRRVRAQTSLSVRAYWAAIGQWLKHDRRFARLAEVYAGPRLDLLPNGTDFQIARRGEDGRFVATVLRVPHGTLRDRSSDVLSPAELVRDHAGYRQRVLMGPTWRADVWTVLEGAPDLTVSDVARRVSCSFATAWQTARDFRLLRAAGTIDR